MKFTFTRSALMSCACVGALAISPSVMAQQITSTVRGVVTTPDGAPAVGQSVTVTDTRTGAVRTIITGSSGNYSVRGLSVGGPYSVSVDSDSYQDTTVTGITLGLQGASDLNITLNKKTGDDTIVITATKSDLVQIAVGPSTSFSLSDINAQPSVSRQIRDVIRVDPRVNVARSGNGSSINCLGGNSKGNAFTIDGVRSGDPFGLNASGNSARSTFPIPFDTVAAAAVEFSPIDVEYGQFTGCAVNVTTKSGTNELHGSVFGLYTGDGLTGDKIDGNDIDADFDNYNWGAEIGGPIIKDKLFFYGSYEETDAGGIQNRGIGSGFANPITAISQTDADRAGVAIQDIFGRDVGESVSTLPNTSRRFFGRLDWNVNDDHRLEATYAKLEESSLRGDDIGGGRGQFTFSDNFYNLGTETDSYSARLYSNWTDNFSTEIRASRIEIGDIQDPLGGGEQQDAVPSPRIVVGSGGNEFGGQLFASGPGVFRSANQLDSKVDQLKLAGTYVHNDHAITAGYELDRLTTSNLFIVNATGTLFFDTIDDLEAGNLRAIRQNGSFTGDAVDAGADQTRNNHTFYIQDEWQVNGDLQLVAGLRYDILSSGDTPQNNPVFQERYGFSNQQGIDGFSIFQPRLGLTYDLPERYGDTTLTAGYGRFTGGDPTVFFSNAFQNFGGALALGDAGDDFGAGDVCNATDLAGVITGGAFNGLPGCIAAEQQGRTTAFSSSVAATDPNFKAPSVDRFSLGLNHFTQNTGSSFFDNWNAKVDFIYSSNNNTIDFVELNSAPNGTAPDGRPIFSRVDPLLAGCDATLNGDLRGYAGLSPECFAGASVPQQIILTNATNGDGSAVSISTQFAKEFEFSDASSLNVNLGYAYSDSEIGNAANSSTASSSFRNVGASDFNNIQVADSLFSNKHNFVAGATYRKEFWEDAASTFGLFFRVNTGRPLSFVFDRNTSGGTFGDPANRARSLLYVPTGPNDPLVTFAPGFDTAGFFNFINENDLNDFSGSIVDRSSFRQPSAADLDLRFSQEVPVPIEGHKLEFSINFENFLNFVSSNAGVKRFGNANDGTSEGLSVVNATIQNGQYLYDNFDSSAADSIVDANDTLWRIQVGAKYKF